MWLFFRQDTTGCRTWTTDIRYTAGCRYISLHSGGYHCLFLFANVKPVVLKSWKPILFQSIKPELAIKHLDGNITIFSYVFTWKIVSTSHVVGHPSVRSPAQIHQQFCSALYRVCDLPSCGEFAHEFPTNSYFQHLSSIIGYYPPP